MTHRPRPVDRGSLSVEYVLIVPMVFLVFAVILAFGKKANVDGNLDSATRDATRAASQANSGDQAEDVAKRSVADIMGSGADCTTKVVIQNASGGPELDSTNFAAGVILTVKATCSWDITTLLGPTITMKPTSQFSSMVDPNRVLAP